MSQEQEQEEKQILKHGIHPNAQSQERLLVLQLSSSRIKTLRESRQFTAKRWSKVMGSQYHRCPDTSVVTHHLLLPYSKTPPGCVETPPRRPHTPPRCCYPPQQWDDETEHAQMTEAAHPVPFRNKHSCRGGKQAATIATATVAATGTATATGTTTTATTKNAATKT